MNELAHHLEMGTVPELWVIESGYALLDGRIIAESPYGAALSASLYMLAGSLG